MLDPMIVAWTDLVKADFLTLEVAEATTVGRTTTTATATTTTSVEAATTSATTEATTSTTTTVTTTTTSTKTTTATSIILRAWLTVVKTNWSRANVSPLHGLKRSLSLIDGSKGYVTETLWLTSLTISWETDTHDGTVRRECLSNGLLSNVERQVAEEESVGWLTDLITVRLTTISLIWLRWTWVGEVDVKRTAIKLETLFGGVSGSSVCGIDEFNVAETRLTLV